MQFWDEMVDEEVERSRDTELEKLGEKRRDELLTSFDSFHVLHYCPFQLCTLTNSITTMAIFGLFGSSDPAPQESSASAELFSSTTFRSNVVPSQPEAQGSSFIPDPPSQSAPTPAPTAPAPTALDAFGSAFDPARLHPLAGLSENLDFLQLDEEKLNDLEGAASVLPSRGWTDDLCVGTGTTYLSGSLGVCYTSTWRKADLVAVNRLGYRWHLGLKGRNVKTAGKQPLLQAPAEQYS